MGSPSGRFATRRRTSLSPSLGWNPLSILPLETVRRKGRSPADGRCLGGPRAAAAAGGALRFVRGGDRCALPDRCQPVVGRAARHAAQRSGGMRAAGVRGWRQKRRWLLKIKPLSHRVRSSNQRAKRPQRVELYVRQAVHLAERARVSLEALEGAGCAEATRSEIMTYLELVERLAGQVRRRVLEGERALRTLLLAPLSSLELANMDWVIGSGESSPGSLPVQLDCVRAMRGACLGQRVPFFFKQCGGVFKNRTGRVLDGRAWDEVPLGASSTGVHFES